MTRVWVYCSEVAALVGQNRFRKRWEAFGALFRRVERGQYYLQAQQRWEAQGRPVATEEERVQQALKATGLDREVALFLHTPVSTSQDLQKSVATLETHLQAQATHLQEHKRHLHTLLAEQVRDQQVLEQQRQALLLEAGTAQTPRNVQQALETVTSALQTHQAHVKSTLALAAAHETTCANFRLAQQKVISEKQTAFGREQEEHILTSHVLGRVTDNNNAFYHKVLGSLHLTDTPPDSSSSPPPKPWSWGLGGRIDGFRDGKLVEIKHRKSRLFDPLPVYDVIQVQCYLQVLDLAEALLIQRLATAPDDPGYSIATTTQETCLVRDDEYWTSFLLPELQVIMATLYRFCHNLLWQDQFFQTPDQGKTRILNGWLDQVRSSISSSTLESTGGPPPSSQPTPPPPGPVQSKRRRTTTTASRRATTASRRDTTASRRATTIFDPTTASRRATTIFDPTTASRRATTIFDPLTTLSGPITTAEPTITTDPTITTEPTTTADRVPSLPTTTPAATTEPYDERPRFF